MRLPAKRPALSIAVVAALAVILAVTALLQYRWIGQVSEADRRRMQESLQTAVRQFREEFNRELLDVCAAFQQDPAALPSATLSESYARRYDNWMRTAQYPQLVANLFLVERGEENEWRLRQFDESGKTFEAVPWPPRLERFRSRAPLPSAGSPRIPRLGNRPFAWIIDPETSLLFQPLLDFPERRRERIPQFPRFQGYLLAELSLDFMRDELFPELAARYFGGPDGFIYQVAILSGREPGAIIYESHPELTAEVFLSSDARAGLLFTPRDAVRERLDSQAEDRPRPGSPRRKSFRFGGNGTPGFRTRGPILVLPGAEDSNWQLAARHPEGSLDAFVDSLRRRNLAISFGALLLLGASMAMIIISSQRAQRLARLQMDFVAGVSHELRTPLAVICSAAENLADGVVGADPRVKQYGELIRGEGRRLAGMVEQTLQFAAGQSGRRRYDPRPVQVADIIDAALAESQRAIGAAGFTVEKNIAPNLPPVKADAAALSQCVQNLISNALKYGSKNRWMAVRAQAASAAQGSEVQVTVEDKGGGIDPADLPHIFEPFYRGRAAAEKQIHGTGLGLSLTQETVAAMGGQISVKNAPGQGSSFTLHLPALPAAPADRESQAGRA